MNKAKAIFGLTVFAFGLAGGALMAQAANPAPPESPWRELPLVSEPAGATEVAAMIVADDARGLARALDLQMLEQLAEAINPLVEVHEIRFTGATQRGGDILSSYVASGRDMQGQNFLVGVVFRVRDGKVIGVN